MLEVVENKKISSIHSRNMAVGQIGRIINTDPKSNYANKVIMKIYGGSFVCLTHPNITWDEQASYDIELVENGTTFTVTNNM